MPELPEIETLKNSITPKILNQRIISITKHRANLRYILPEFDTAHNAIIESTQRRAKYLLLHLNNGHSLVVHLGMSGQLLLHTPDIIPSPHDHLTIELENEILIYRDPRRFGMVDIINTKKLWEHKYFINLGPEPLGPDFTPAYLKLALTKRTSTIKQAIMDNNIVVGVGNIYASESLFKSEIAPHSIASKVPLQKLIQLVDAIQETLTEAIKAGGSTLRDFVDSDNNSGYFQQQLLVYGRTDEECSKCSFPIKQMKQAGRRSYYCSKCQKKY